METIPEVWEMLQNYIQASPHHGIENWLVLQNFYDGLIPMSKGHLDAAAGGAFLSLTIDGAMALINKMVSNQSWREERKTQKGMHTVKEMDMLSTKKDLLMKRLKQRAQEKEAMKGTVQAMDSHMTCEVCGYVAIQGMTAPKPTKKLPSSTMGFPNHQVTTSGITNPAHKVI